MDLLQIATGITKCDDYYKLRQYTHLLNIAGVPWLSILGNFSIYANKEKQCVVRKGETSFLRIESKIF